MRASTSKLHKALMEAGLHEMAFRAATEVYHDFLSPLEDGSLALLSELMDAYRRRKGDYDKVLALIADHKNGEFDATMAESDEWAAGADGQAAFNKLRTAGVPDHTILDMFGLSATKSGSPH